MRKVPAAIRDQREVPIFLRALSRGSGEATYPSEGVFDLIMIR